MRFQVLSRLFRRDNHSTWLRAASTNTRGARAFPTQKLKDDLEKFNAVPFPRVVGIERCVLHPNPITGRRPWVEHLKRVATAAKSFRKRSLNSWPFGYRRRCFHRAHRFLRTKWRSEFLGRSSRDQRDEDCDHQCLHISLSFDACEMLPITTPAHNISFDGFS